MKKSKKSQRIFFFKRLIKLFCLQRRCRSTAPEGPAGQGGGISLANTNIPLSQPMPGLAIPTYLKISKIAEETKVSFGIYLYLFYKHDLKINICFIS